MKQAGWPVAKLGDHCEVFSGYPFKSTGFTDNPDDVALVKGENVGQGEILWDISKRWPQEDADQLDRFKLLAGDVVLAMDRPWVPAGLKYARIPESAPEALLVQRVARLRARDGLEQAFLPFLIASPSFVAYIQNIGRGVGVPHISGREIQGFGFKLPPKPVQLRIAQVLSAYDDMIENSRRRIALLEQSARLLYQEWFVRLRFPGHEHTRTTNGIPEPWDRVPFEDALVLQRGFDLPEREWQEGEFPICCSTGIVGFHKEAKVKGPGVFTGRSGSLGVVNYVESDYWPHNTALWVREFKRVTPLFALFLLREMNLKQYNGGASVPTLDRKAVHRVPVLIPPRRLITLFDDQVEPMFSQLRNLREQNEKLRAARDLLLPRLMSGEIAV